MTIGILQCGSPPESLPGEHGSYGAMMQGMLGPKRDTRIYDVTKGELPVGILHKA